MAFISAWTSKLSPLAPPTNQPTTGQLSPQQLSKQLRGVSPGVHLQPGEDVHQTVLGHSVHDALAVLQHGLKLGVSPTVGRAEAEGADDVGDGSGEFRRQIQGQSSR